MKKYRILISYYTGDSFGSQDTEDYLDLSWDSLKVAKENLQAVKEHYKMYNHIESPPWGEKRLSRKEIHKQYKDKWWFPETENSYFLHHLMKLKTDKGILMQQHNFWCGYFEGLYGAEIVGEDNDMKFEV